MALGVLQEWNNLLAQLLQEQDTKQLCRLVSAGRQWAENAVDPSDLRKALMEDAVAFARQPGPANEAVPLRPLVASPSPPGLQPAALPHNRRAFRSLSHARQRSRAGSLTIGSAPTLQEMLGLAVDVPTIDERVMRSNMRRPSVSSRASSRKPSLANRSVSPASPKDPSRRQRRSMTEGGPSRRLSASFARAEIDELLSAATPGSPRSPARPADPPAEKAEKAEKAENAAAGPQPVSIAEAARRASQEFEQAREDASPPPAPSDDPFSNEAAVELPEPSVAASEDTRPQDDSTVFSDNFSTQMMYDQFGREVQTPFVQACRRSIAIERGDIIEEEQPYAPEDDVGPIVTRSREIQTRLMEKYKPRTFSFKTPLAPFHPNNRWRMLWTVLLMIIIAVECVWLPMDLAFETFERPKGFGYTIVVLFLVDMLLTFNTAIYDDGFLCTTRSLIVSHYVKGGHLALDLLSSFPFFLVAQAVEGSESSYKGGAKVAQSAGKLLHTLRLLRAGRLRFMLESCVEVFPLAVLSRVEALGFLCKMALAAHWAACMCWYLHQLSHDSAPFAHLAPWAGGERSFASDYLQAALWSVTVLTRGAGDVSEAWTEKATAQDRVVQLCFEAVAFVCGLYLVAAYVGMYAHRNVEQEVFKFEKAGVRQLMTQRKVPTEIQVRVRQQMELEFSYRQTRIMEAARFDGIRRLTPSVRQEFYAALNRSTLVRHPFFSALPKRPLARLCELAESVLFREGEIVCKRGHAAFTMFFIVCGELEVCFDEDEGEWETCDMSTHDQSTSIGAKIRVSAPSWVGDQCLFVEDAKRVCTLIAAINSELLALSRPCLLDILLEFPSVRPNYLEMRRCIERGKLEYAGIVCSVCKKPGHNVTTCPVVTQHYEQRGGSTWAEDIKSALRSSIDGTAKAAGSVGRGLTRGMSQGLVKTAALVVSPLRRGLKIGQAPVDESQWTGA